MVVDSNKRTVAVFGAVGYTGQFVITELLRRNIQPIAIARNGEALKAIYSKSTDVITRQATLHDTAKLDEALAGAQIVINCAGPVAQSAEPLAKAALRLGIHYLDVSAEQTTTFKLLKEYDLEAKEKGIAIIPALAYFGGLADLMATVLMGDWKSADSIEVMVGFDSWYPTLGTRNTFTLVSTDSQPRKHVRNGKLTDYSEPGCATQWKFQPPIGEQGMLECPLSEIHLIAHHLKATEVTNYITAVALGNVIDPNTPPPKSNDETGRSPQRFIVDVIVKHGNQQRSASVQGRDGYATTAPMLCEAAERLIAGQFNGAGAKAPAEFFDAEDFLKVLGDEVKFKVAETI